MARKKKAEEQTEHPLETLGQRIARKRKEKGLTQVELAKLMDLSQVLISDYERGRLRPNPELIVKFAATLKMTTDELLGVKLTSTDDSKLSLKTVRRMKKIEDLSPAQQKALFKTIDTFLKGAEK